MSQWMEIQERRLKAMRDFDKEVMQLQKICCHATKSDWLIDSDYEAIMCYNCRKILYTRPRSKGGK